MRVHLTLNGLPAEITVSGDEALLDTLRAAGMTGAKEGCGVGVCGLCTVLVDRAPVSSCLYLAACAEGRDVWTVEGLTAHDPELVNAFASHEALQCGICTPGQVVSLYALAQEAPEADEAQIREQLVGNLCRCTGYRSIIAAGLAYVAGH